MINVEKVLYKIQHSLMMKILLGNQAKEEYLQFDKRLFLKNKYIGDILKSIPSKVKKSISNSSIFASFHQFTGGLSQRNKRRKD